MNNLVIGIAGYARSGKNTLADIISETLFLSLVPTKQYSFAYELKKDTQYQCISKFGIDSFTENSKEKEIIRPTLIEHGIQKRKESNGTYWWSKIKREIEEDFDHGRAFVAIITDCRFYEYKGQDEVDFIKSYKNNLLISVKTPGIKPAHESEAINMPMIENVSDYILEWPNLGNSKVKGVPYCLGLIDIIQEKLHD